MAEYETRIPTLRVPAVVDAARAGVRKGEASLTAAETAVRAAIASYVEEQLIDEMGRACIVRGVADKSAQQHDTAYADKSQEALDDTLSPLGRLIGHDWIGQVLGLADATKDEALELLFRTAGSMAADAAWDKGVKARGSVAKYLAAQGVVISDIEENMTRETASLDENKPFIDFLKAVEAACVEMMGADWWTHAVSSGSSDELETALQCAGYDGDAAQVASLRHAIGLSAPIITGVDLSNTSDSTVHVVTEGVQESPADPCRTAVAFARTVMKDPDIATLLGVSRGTVANIAEGKAKKPVTPAGASQLRTALEKLAEDATQAAGGLHVSL